MNIILSCLCNSLHLLFPFARYGIKFFNKNIVGPSRIQWQKWPPPLPESTVVCFQVCPLFHASYNSPLGNCVTSRQVTSNQLRPNSFILCANLSFGPILKVTVSQANQLTGINITNSDFGETETKYHLCLILILQIGPDIAPRIANARPDVPRMYYCKCLLARCAGLYSLPPPKMLAKPVFQGLLRISLRSDYYIVEFYESVGRDSSV